MDKERTQEGPVCKDFGDCLHESCWQIFLEAFVIWASYTY